MSARITGAGTLNGPVEIGFASVGSWPTSPLTGHSPLQLACIHFGRPDIGPVLFLFVTSPGADLPDGAAHGHASDSWRMPLSGSMHVGRRVYGAGESRLQPGWLSYPSDNFPVGEHGGSLALLFGDRRGTAVRPAQNARTTRPESEPAGVETAIARWADLDLDLDPPCPRSSLTMSSSTAPLRRAADTNFAARDGWTRYEDGREVLRVELGDPDHGPLMWLHRTPPGLMATTSFTTPTEVVRLVAAGTANSGRGYRGPGSVWVTPAAHTHPITVAGGEGLDEVVIFGDRQDEREIFGRP